MEKADTPLPVPPILATQNELAACEPHGERYQLLASAAQINQPRVRELIALAKGALGKLPPSHLGADCAPTGEDIDRARELLAALEFGLGALLPPANIHIKARLAELISQSGRKAA